MVCDSTNVFVDGHAGSEAEVRDALIPLIGQLKGKVAVACFASNVARMDTIIRAAEANGRRVCLVGRSMHRMAAAAKSVGLMQDLQPFIDDNEAKHFPADKVLYLCTGSQGEPRAALSRIADGTHPHVNLGAGRRLRLLPPGDPGQRDPDPQPAEQARRPRRAALHRARPPGHPRLGPPLPRRAGRDVPLGPAARSRCRPTASAATCWSTPPSPATCRSRSR